MYDWQLEKILRSDPYTSKLFRGVYPIDRLPKAIKFPAALIANTQPSDQEGEHWVSFYLLSEREGDFFDSYGHPPGSLDPKFRKWMTSVVSKKNAQLFYNQRRVQGPLSSTCGHYCLYFLLLRARGVSSEDIIKRLGPEPMYSDFLVKQFIECHFGSMI